MLEPLLFDPSRKLGFPGHATLDHPVEYRNTIELAKDAGFQ